VALDAFARARERGEKYIFAVEEAAKAVEDRGFSMSETEVKRSLAELSPLGGTSLIVTQTVVEGEEAERIRSMLEHLPDYRRRRAQENPQSTNNRRPIKAFKLQFGPRPTYPRCNAKI
jgi:hypothetical protein